MNRIRDVFEAGYGPSPLVQGWWRKGSPPSNLFHSKYIFPIFPVAQTLTNKPNVPPHPTTGPALHLHPHSSFSLSVSSSLSRPPLPPLSAHTPSLRKSVLPENKQENMEREEGNGGRCDIMGQQRMLLSFFCLSGCCRPHCDPSWGSWAYVTLTGPGVHACSLVPYYYCVPCSHGSHKPQLLSDRGQKWLETWGKMNPNYVYLTLKNPPLKPMGGFRFIFRYMDI